MSSLPLKEAPDIDQQPLLIKTMSKIYVESIGSDVIFQVEDGKQYKANRDILAAQSPVFASMFYNKSFKESTQSVIRLPGKKSQPFEIFLKFLYTCHIEVSKYDLETLLEVLHLAHEYQIIPLVEALSQILEPTINAENALKIFEAALSVGSGHLLEACRGFLSMSSSDVLKSPQFFELPKTALMEIVTQDNFGARDIDLLFAINNWADNNKEVDISDVLAKVPLQSVSMDGLKMEEIAPLFRLLFSYGIGFDTTRMKLEGMDPEMVTYSMNNGLKSPLYQSARFLGPSNVATVQNGTIIYGPEELHKSRVLGSMPYLYLDFMPMGSPITIQMPQAYKVTSLAFRIYSTGGECVSYKIETSVDQTKWDVLANCQTLACFERQLFMFSSIFVRFVKITGYNAPSYNEQKYGMVEFQCPANVTAKDQARYAQKCQNGGTLRFQVYNNTTTTH